AARLAAGRADRVVSGDAEVVKVNDDRLAGETNAVRGAEARADGDCRKAGVATRSQRLPGTFVEEVAGDESVPANKAERAVLVGAGARSGSTWPCVRAYELAPLGRAPAPHLPAFVVGCEERPEQGLDAVSGRPGGEGVLDAGVEVAGELAQRADV